MDQTGSLASRIAPNGDLYTALLFLDFNAMYLWSQEQDLPLSPGLRWTLSNGYYTKKPLASNTSLSALLNTLLRTLLNTLVNSLLNILLNTLLNTLWDFIWNTLLFTNFQMFSVN